MTTDERLEITRRVMRALRHETSRTSLGARNASGVSQIIICMDSDTVEYANSRVARVGGRANVMVPHDGGIARLEWVISDDDALFEDIGPIHPESTLGMLLEYLASSQTERCQFSISSEYGRVDVSEAEDLTLRA